MKNGLYSSRTSISDTLGVRTCWPKRRKHHIPTWRLLSLFKFPFFPLFVSLSHAHVGDFNVLCTEKKSRIGLCWVLQSSQDKSRTSTDRKMGHHFLSLLPWRKKTLHNNQLTLSSFFVFLLRSVVLGRTIIWFSRASDFLSLKYTG